MRKKAKNSTYTTINFVLLLVIIAEVSRLLFLYYKKRERSVFTFKRNKKHCEISFYVENSKKEEETLKIAGKSIGILLYFPDSFKCAYKNDRADLIIPEINKIAQYLRSTGSRIIFKSNISNINTFNDDIQLPERDEWDSKDFLLQNYSEKSCLFKGYEKNPLQSDETVNHGILISSKSDTFVKTFDDSVRFSYHSKLTHVFLCGMASNEWMPLAVQQFNKAGITPIILQDITDVSYSYRTQKNVYPTHNAAIESFLSFMQNKNVKVANHFDVLSNILTAECIPIKPDYDTNNNFSHYYKYFYE